MDGKVSQWAQHFQTIFPDGGQMAPRAMKLTSKPAWASLPPKYPPMAPPPMTAIFMSLFPD